MRIVKLFAIVAAIAFVISRLFLYFDPNFASEQSDPVGALAFSIGFIIGSYIMLIPFLVGYIRDIPSKWWILVLLFGAPFIAGFFAGFVGAGPAGLAFVNTVIAPIAWVGGLVWSIVEKKPIS
jgi:cytochrome c oxidase assembly factor CtaG